jgi:hypothetical protein
MCLERLERFLRDCGERGVAVLLAGIQPDLLAAMTRLGFFAWFPPDRVYPQGRDENSATLAAIRSVHRALGGARTQHADSGQAAQGAARPLYYLL